MIVYIITVLLSVSLFAIFRNKQVTMIRSAVFLAFVALAFGAPTEEKSETVVVSAAPYATPYAAPYAFAAPYAAAGSPILGAPLLPKISYEKAEVKTYQPVVKVSAPEYQYKAVPVAVPTAYAAPYYAQPYAYPYAYGYPYTTVVKV
ncbi:uncharacterized protein LOC136039429 [Artemia franciscana]|uniref:uncharacterized protein LOC136039429 n=1 Tax=Artemia franciscana TaxID=6661 RepID=UPI0032DB582D